MLKTISDIHNADPLLGALPDRHNPEWIAEGVILTTSFGCSGDESIYDPYPLLGEITQYETLGRFGRFNAYGVCDSHLQVLDKCKEIEADPDREFFIRLTSVKRDDQPRQGGWRWHKWGEYIGNHKPEHEYLHDEEGIDLVYCYHVYERLTA